LITRFGVPPLLVFDNEAYFSSTLLKDFSLDKGIIIKYSGNYYPQGNDVVESTNKNLVRILKKRLQITREIGIINFIIPYGMIGSHPKKP
jgi:hypothetical protein